MKKCPGCMGEYGDEKKICPACGWSDETARRQQESYPEALQPGMALGDRYFLGRVIRQDAYSILYTGWDELLRDKVCIEEYFPTDLVYRKYPEADGDSGKFRVPSGLKKMEYADIYEKGRDAFVRESAFLHSLQRIPELVQIYRVLHDNNSSYRIMEYLDGCRLSNELEKDITRNSLTDSEFLDILYDALTALHKEGLGHMNLKPDNIVLVGGDIRYKMVKLIGVGMARAQLHVLMGGVSGLYEDEEDTFYIAPEILRGEMSVPELADAYSYGAICKSFPQYRKDIEGLLAEKKEERIRLEDFRKGNAEERK